MSRTYVKRRHSDVSQFESVARIASLPIVESGIHIAGNVYNKIKRSNSLMSWSLDTAEHSLAVATESARPAIFALDRPITMIDQLLCRGIDIVEQRVPAVHFPPQLLYSNTREFLDKKFVRPVLRRAGSVTQIGNQVADAAADRLDGALTVVDEYVDHYLPADPADKATDDASPMETVSKTARTIKHGARFSRKLQRRITRRTLVEARALKEQGTECIHVLLYVVELIATDPKLALQKTKELCAALSLPEPENQARPATLEQLLVLLTRESARRVVHLVHGTASLAARIPRRLGRALLAVSYQLLTIADTAFKMTSIVDSKGDEAKARESILQAAVQRLSCTTNIALTDAIGKMVAQSAQLPQLEALDRVLGLPIIELALATSICTYSRVRDSNQWLHWVLSSAETSLTNATKQAVPMAAPIAKKFENSIRALDRTLCLGLDKIEEKVPIVRETPNRIMENAYTLASETVRSAVSTIIYANESMVARASDFKESSWNKTNRILETNFGTAAVNRLDGTAIAANQLLDKYFPASGIEEETAIVSAEEDKLLHTLQTVGQLSNKTARRLYNSVIVAIGTINKESFKSYVSSIVQFLQLTRYIHAVNDQAQCLTAPKTNHSEKSTST